MNRADSDQRVSAGRRCRENNWRFRRKKCVEEQIIEDIRETRYLELKYEAWDREKQVESFGK